MNNFSEQEQEAVSAISNIMNFGYTTEKRQHESMDDADEAGGNRPTKRARATLMRKLQPAPYFLYRDYSREVDDDPLTPLTPPGRVPNVRFMSCVCLVISL
jgi:hypothetical protein